MLERPHACAADAYAAQACDPLAMQLWHQPTAFLRHAPPDNRQIRALPVQRTTASQTLSSS